MSLLCFSSCQWYSSTWCKAFPASVIRIIILLSLSLPACLPLSLGFLATVIMKGISMSFCAKGSEDLPALCSPKPICHAYFIQRACITFDYTLIRYFLNVFRHSGCFMKSHLHKHILNIHTGAGTLLIVPKMWGTKQTKKNLSSFLIHVKYGNELDRLCILEVKHKQSPEADFSNSWIPFFRFSSALPWWF